MSRPARPAPALALTASLALLLGACGGSANSDRDAAPATGDDGTPTGTVTVLAAASLVDVLELVAADVEADHPGVRVEQSFAASSTIVQQVNEGAPADVVALAGLGPLEQLAEEHRRSDAVIFTTNALELVTPADDPAGITGPDDLARDDVRLVVCQPEVPCGAAAATLFDQLGVEPEVASYEPDVRATLSKVQLGEADLGIVYRTDVAAAGDGVRGIPLPAEDDVTTDYPVLAVSDSPLARVVVEELLSARGQQHLADAGFVAP